jgi:hypothetical protein
MADKDPRPQPERVDRAYRTNFLERERKTMARFQVEIIHSMWFRVTADTQEAAEQIALEWAIEKSHPDDMIDGRGGYFPATVIGEDGEIIEETINRGRS